MEYDFKSGKYAGKSIEQVAVADYMYLEFLKQNRTFENEFTRRADEVIFRLNNFVSPVKCRECSKNVTQISILKGYSGEVSISSFYTCCDVTDHLARETERIIMYPIQYDILHLFPEFPKHIRQDIQEVLLELTGFKGKKTKQSLEEHINSLALKSQNPDKISKIDPGNRNKSEEKNKGSQSQGILF